MMGRFVLSIPFLTFSAGLGLRIEDRSWGGLSC